MSDQRFSNNDASKRDIPSFIEPRPPLISNPFMRPRPQKGTNLLELFEDSDCEEPELVQVYLRLKPCNIRSDLYEVKSNRCLITSLDTATVGHGRRTQQNVSKVYTFSHIFGAEANQKELFDRIVKDNLKKLPEGHSFTLLTYGASGSGKTFTLMGTVAAPGLVPRSLEYVFKVVDAAQKPLYKPADNGAEKLSYSAQENELQFVKQICHLSAPLRDKYRRMSVQLRNELTTSSVDLTNRTKYYIWVSFVEIYNEGIYDLLSNTDRTAASKLIIREDSNGNVYVKGAIQVFVRTGAEAYDVMVAGKHNLQVAATGVNTHSSRSHCIFTITMLTETDAGCRVSTVRLCDLAGCERVRRTRNAGARLVESRAINSSLHVLERCLRTLRQRQRAGRDALVPYRESKLTRLLGAGLSGARGETVCVVVTLNPAPECAHETKHVLQLAAVAKDIQVNSTVSEFSSLETSVQDSSLVNAEVLKLRVENERVHFELLQAETQIRDMRAAMAENQATNAATMRELVDEAKDSTKQYYESLLKAAKNETEELKEEYDNKISELMKEKAVLEEKLNAEILARARVETELEHLRICIEERDEKAYKEARKSEEDVMSLSDSSEESDSAEANDTCNESLEPTFKRETINRSRLMRQSFANTPDTTDNIFEYSLSDDSDARTAERIDDTVTFNKSVETSTISLDDDEVAINNDDKETGTDCEDNVDKFETDGIDVCVASEAVISSSDAIEEKCMKQMLARGTYFVRRSQDDSRTDQSSVSVEPDRDKSGDVMDVKQELQESGIGRDDDITKESQNLEEETSESSNVKMPRTIRDTLVKKIIKSLKSVSEDHNSNASLAQFEQLELAANEMDTQMLVRKSVNLLKIVKDKKTYFNDNVTNVSNEISNNAVSNESSKDRKVYFDNLDSVIDSGNNKILSDVKTACSLKCDQFRSPSIVKEDTCSNYEPSTMKLFGESFTRQPDPISSISTNLLKKKKESVDVFESFASPRDEIPVNDKKVEDIRKSIFNIVLNDKSEEVVADTNIEFKNPALKEEAVVNTKVVLDEKSPMENIQDCVENETEEPTVDTSRLDTENKVDNTLMEFEKIYKDVSQSRTTDFELLVTQTINDTNPNLDSAATQIDENPPRYNLRKKTLKTSESEDNECRSDCNKDIDENYVIEVLKKNQEVTKCESALKTKRKLRLRRRKQVDSENTEQDNAQLKDIVNLQTEFSDVTLGVPAPTKDVKDIASPVKVDEVENIAPMQEIQSCPSKSVTRSRRKLFTPRAEPLDEDFADGEGASGERVRVPRPSYQRPRARRKL